MGCDVDSSTRTTLYHTLRVSSRPVYCADYDRQTPVQIDVFTQ